MKRSREPSSSSLEYRHERARAIDRNNLAAVEAYGAQLVEELLHEPLEDAQTSYDEMDETYRFIADLTHHKHVTPAVLEFYRYYWSRPPRLLSYHSAQFFTGGASGHSVLGVLAEAGNWETIDYIRSRTTPEFFSRMLKVQGGPPCYYSDDGAGYAPIVPPLFSAVDAGQLETTRRLLDWGANPNITYQGETILVNMLRRREDRIQIPMVRLLLKNGVEPCSWRMKSWEHQMIEYDFSKHPKVQHAHQENLVEALVIILWPDSNFQNVLELIANYAAN